MCIKCFEAHEHENRVKAIQYYYDTLVAANESQKNIIFEKFNTTSLLMLFYTAFGQDGELSKTQAIYILREFVCWIKTNKWEFYMPTHGLEAMWHSQLISEITDWCQTYQYTYEETNTNECNTCSETNQDTNAVIDITKYAPMFEKIAEIQTRLRKNWIYYYREKLRRDTVITDRVQEDKNTKRFFYIGAIIGTGLGLCLNMTQLSMMSKISCIVLTAVGFVVSYPLSYYTAQFIKAKQEPIHIVLNSEPDSNSKSNAD